VRTIHRRDGHLGWDRDLEPVVEVASRDPDGSWRSVIHRDLQARLRLEALGVEIGLDEVFARVEFTEQEAPRASGEA